MSLRILLILRPVIMVSLVEAMSRVEDDVVEGGYQ